jgi:two-component system chemotaxis sensor kinase CheA
VEDDGRGIEIEKVTEAAIAKGLISRAAAAAASPRELVRLVLRAGVSTSPEVTKLAGRGMGLSVVQEEVARLQGEVIIAGEAGQGTRIEISVPLLVSTHSVLLVECRRHRFALPGRAIDRLCRLRLKDIEWFEGAECFKLDGQPVPLARLADLLELPEQPHAPGWEAGGVIAVAVLRSGSQRVGLAVDALLDQREALIEDLGVPAAMAGLATGGIPMEDGGVAVVVSPQLLMERFQRGGRPPGPAAEAAAGKKAATILVVDDSITTRALEKSILEAHGYKVRVAVDGLEALEQLRAEPVDLVITDLAMPRMDGFELVEKLKSDKRLAGLPVIIVTSLDKREDQERGLALGANAYIVKRKFDQRELLSVVRQIL